MLISSSYSGTRTATAMIGIGLLYYLFFEINNVRVLLSMFVLFAVFMAIIFGPFHGPTVRRIRSTFQPSEDASYQVREYNRERIRPYILSHPIGGGLFTSGGTIKDLGYHPLASIPPDGYFMRMAMETGWIGLLIQLVLFGTIIIVGIRIYFQTIDYYSENERYALKGFITVIIMLSAAGYAQDNAFQIPYVFVAWGIIGYVASAYKKTFLKVESA
jgi:cell division protein FtsW (lipid II flippase)